MANSSAHDEFVAEARMIEESNKNGTNNTFKKYQTEFGQKNNTHFISREEKNVTDGKSEKAIYPQYDSMGAHLGFLMAMMGSKKILDIDSFDGSCILDEDISKENYVIVIPKIAIDDTDITSPGKRWHHFQSSSNECWIIGSKICKILSFVPNDILIKCIESGIERNLASKCGLSNSQAVFDFKKLDEEMPGILPHIFSFCQNTKYIKKFCEAQKIDYKSFMEQSFIKVTNRDNPEKYTNMTNLQKLLSKDIYRVNDKNHRPQIHATKKGGFGFL